MAKCLIGILALSASFLNVRSETDFCRDGSVCKNDGLCVAVEGRSGTYECKCFTTKSIAVYAGISCEHEAADYCLFNSRSGAEQTFCTNGKCKEKFSPKEGVEIEHRGCICDEGYEGDFCELESAALELESKSQTTHVGVISFISVLLTSALIAILTVYIKRGKVPTEIKPDNQPNGEVI